MTDNVNNLIDQLLQDHHPIPPERHPLLRTLPVAVGIVAYMAVITLLIGLRSDWLAMLTQSFTYQLELLLAFTVSVTAILAAGWLRIPYMKSQAWVIAAALVSAGIFLSFEVFRLINEGITLAAIQTFRDCYVHALALASLPTMVLVIMQKSGSTTRPYLSALTGTLAIGGFAWIGLRLTCSLDLAGHNAIVQLSPFMLLGLGLGIFARRLYKW